MTGAGVAELSGVWKRYSRRGAWVLREVELRIEDGAVHVLVDRATCWPASSGIC